MNEQPIAPLLRYEAAIATMTERVSNLSEAVGELNRAVAGQTRAMALASDLATHQSLMAAEKNRTIDERLLDLKNEVALLRTDMQTELRQRVSIGGFRSAWSIIAGAAVLIMMLAAGFSAVVQARALHLFGG